MEGGGGRGSRPPLKKSNKYRVSYQYWSGSPEEAQRYKASIQCWASIGPRWRAVDGPLIVIFGSSYQLRKKTNVKAEPPLTKLSGSAHGMSFTNVEIQMIVCCFKLVNGHFTKSEFIHWFNIMF